MTLAKVKVMKTQQKNWPANEVVMGLKSYLSDKSVIEAGGARAFSVWVKLSLRINSGTIKIRCEAN